MTEMAWNRSAAERLRALAAQDAIVLLPVAPTEQHGPHLPTGVDDFLCSEVCRRTAALLAPGLSCCDRADRVVRPLAARLRAGEPWAAPQAAS